MGIAVTRPACRVARARLRQPRRAQPVTNRRHRPFESQQPLKVFRKNACYDYVLPYFPPFQFFNEGTPMSRICAITGKRPTKGGRIIRKGLTKKSGGIGTSLVKNTRRKFSPNVQRVRVKLPSGEVKRIWVSVKAIKAGKVTKA